MRRIGVEAARLLGIIAVCQLAGIIGVAFGRDSRRYYAELDKPAFAPPPRVFGPVWLTLYTMMGVSAYLVWLGKRGGRHAPVVLFAVQLALNAAWTPVFFGVRKPGLALIVIVALLPAIALTMFAFWPVSSAAALLLVPYLLWTGFAGMLNYELWRRNGRTSRQQYPV